MSLGLLDLTEPQLLGMTEAELLAMEENETGTSGGGSNSCPWSEATIGEFQTALATIQADVTDIKSRVNALPTNTYAVPTVSEISTGVWGAATRTLTSTFQGGATAAEVWGYASRTLTASPTDTSNLAKSAELSDLQSHGDTSWATASGFATPADVQITVSAEGLEVPTASENAAAVWGSGTRTLTASPTDVSTLAKSAEISALQSHGDTSWATASGFATPADVQITVSAEGLEVPTASGIATAVWSSGSRTLTDTDLSGLESALASITALLGHWTCTADTLTTYDTSGNALASYSLTRDTSGNITSISEAAG